MATRVLLGRVALTYASRMNKNQKPAGERIKDALKQAGRTQSWLAERCGVSDNAVSKWIKSGHVAKGNIPSVCSALNLDSSIFLVAPSTQPSVVTEKMGDCRHGETQPQNTPGTFGQRLKAARTAAKISQAKLAYKVGMAQATICELENDRYPSSSFTPRLAEVLKVSSIWLADGRGPKNGPDSQSEDEIVRERSARETARGLRLAVMAIADKYNVNPCDLVDPSEEALDRIERAIIAARSLSPHPE